MIVNKPAGQRGEGESSSPWNRLWLALGMITLALLLAQCSSSVDPHEREGGQAGNPADSRAARLSAVRPASAPAKVPTVVEGHIVPIRPTATSTLSLDIRAVDPLREAVTFRYRWILDGQPMFGGIRAQLPPGEFVRGQTVSVEVTPIAGGRSGPVWTAPPVEIVNAVPGVQRLEIQPSPVSRREAVRAVVEVVDPDGDKVKVSYQWLRNGTPIAGATEATLAPSYYRQRDLLSVEVTATDGQDATPPLRSHQVDVLPAAPKFVSRVAPTDFKEGRFRYQARAMHPDNKPLRYSLSREAPRGMRIHPQTGRVEWDPDPSQRGTFAFQVIVEDPDGAKVAQPITLTIEEG
ncbi:MAG: putative Ig domain-containing protein [Candidatus Methylomirabilales bacterium]